MNPILIHEEQQKDERLIKSFKENSHLYRVKCMEGCDLVTYHGKIVIPWPLQECTLVWHHEHLAHPGITRLEALLHSVHAWLNLSQDAEHFIQTCKTCQV